MEFSSGDSLGSLPPDQIAQYLEEIGDVARAQALVEASVQGQNFLRPGAPFHATGAQVGFIAADGTGKLEDVVSAAELRADPGLIDSQIKISFDRAFIYEYPGLGTHSILCEFVGRNQIKDETEALRMALRFQSADNAGVSALGVPIFLGLTVGPNGIAFEGRSINVSSSADEFLLEALDGEAFKNGLALVNAVQPGLKPLVALIQGAVKNVVKRTRNTQVHHFNLGLDFSNSATSARLRLGSYVVSQTNSTDWDWSEFVWDRNSLSLRRRDAGATAIDFNYMVIGVSPYTPVAASLPARKSTRAASRSA